jgi:hypothetical protein
VLGQQVMAVVLLILFPILLMYNPRSAFVAIGLAVVFLYRGRSNNARRRAHGQVTDGL